LKDGNRRDNRIHIWQRDGGEQALVWPDLPGHV